MLFVKILIGIALVLFLVYLWAVSPSFKPHDSAEKFKRAHYAHRGFHNKEKGVPENTMLAFAYAVKKGFGIEFDVNLSKDGKTVVMHDDSLKRMCGVDVKISQSNYDDIKGYKIGGTDETTPLLADVLKLVDGKVPLLVELKTVGGNYAALCEKAFSELDNYNGDYMVESFDPRVLMWMRKHRKNVVRGQLACFISTKSEQGKKAILLRNLMLNFLARPHFVAYKFADRRNFSLALCRYIGNCPVFFWTIRNKEDANQALKMDSPFIFEGFDANEL